jgi:hypothetical protein
MPNYFDTIIFLLTYEIDAALSPTNMKPIFGGATILLI